MHSFYLILCFASLASTHPNLPPRSVGSSCTTPDGKGTCQHTSNCKGWSIPGPSPGYCPNDPDDVQCCVQKTCSPPGQIGICQNTNKPCSGQYNSGNFCPGDNSIQCCPTGGSQGGTSSTEEGVGQACHPPGQTGVCKKTTESSCSTGFNGGNYCPGDETIQCCPNPPAEQKQKAPPSTPTVSAPPPVDTCAHPQRDTCSFYPDCLEFKYDCGSGGYPLGYGLKYCEKFTDAKPELDSAGKQWVSDTMLCLQTTLVPYATTETTTCDNLKDDAFASHPRCYIDSGVCTLGPGDWTVIIETVSLKDLFGGIDNLKAVLQTVEGCVEFYEWLIEQGIIGLVHKVEDEGKDIWHKVTSWL